MLGTEIWNLSVFVPICSVDHYCAGGFSSLFLSIKSHASLASISPFSSTLHCILFFLLYAQKRGPPLTAVEESVSTDRRWQEM